MQALAIKGTGMVTAIGLNRKATSAAFRGVIDNFQESHFLNGNGENLLVSEVPLEKPWRGKIKMLKMASLAIWEAIEEAKLDSKGTHPIFICLAESNDGLGININAEQFYHELKQETGLSFAQGSGLFKYGKAGCLSALEHAQKYIQQNQPVIIVAVDTLLTAKLVNKFTEKRWLLTRTTSNGFIPSEAAACIVVSEATGDSKFIIKGYGQAKEPYHEGDKSPFIAIGMTEAVRQTLSIANFDLAFINTWFSHNNTSFLQAKESTLAELKLLRGENILYQRYALTPHFGEVGASAGLLMLILSREVKGGFSLITMANFGENRAAILSEVKK